MSEKPPTTFGIFPKNIRWIFPGLLRLGILPEDILPFGLRRAAVYRRTANFIRLIPLGSAGSYLLQVFPTWPSTVASEARAAAWCHSFWGDRQKNFRIVMNK